MMHMISFSHCKHTCKTESWLNILVCYLKLVVSLIATGFMALVAPSLNVTGSMAFVVPS
jgi:hypothetical protein